MSRRLVNFAAPDAGGAGGSGVWVEYVRLLLDKHRRHTNGCLGASVVILARIVQCSVELEAHVHVNFWMSKIKFADIIPPPAEALRTPTKNLISTKTIQ